MIGIYCLFLRLIFRIRETVFEMIRDNKILHIIGRYTRIPILCCLFMFSLIPFQAKANVYQKDALDDSPGTGNFALFLRHYQPGFKWAARPVQPFNPQEHEKKLPEPSAEQFLDKSKRKGISSQGPEPGAPVFTGIFSGYPDHVNNFDPHADLGIDFQYCGIHYRVRPPPAG